MLENNIQSSACFYQKAPKQLAPQIYWAALMTELGFCQSRLSYGIHPAHSSSSWRCVLLGTCLELSRTHELITQELPMW